MQLLSVPVSDARTETPCELLVLDRRKELKQLAGQNESVPKVMSVDSVVKALFALIQIVGLAVVSWLLVNTIDQGDRITKNETMIEQQRGRDSEILSELRSMNSSLSTALQNQAAARSEISNLKDEVKTLAHKVNGK